MKRSTRTVLVATIGALALLAAACGGTKKTSENPRTPGAKTKKDLVSVPGFDKTKGEIHLGVVTPLTGLVAIVGDPLTAGNQTYFDYVNEKGGIAGKYKVVLDKEDSQYKPDVGVQAYNKLKSKVVMFAQLLGTPIVKAVLPQLKTDGMVAAPASLDADWVREPNLLPVGGPYQIEMINAASYMQHEGGGKGKVQCSMIQDDAYGEAGQAGIDFAAKQFGYKLATTAKVAANTPDLTAQVQQLKRAGCEVVYLVAAPLDTLTLFTAASKLGYAPKWVGQATTWVGLFTTTPLASYFESNYTLVAEGGEWGDKSVKGMADMITRQTKYVPKQKADFYYTFGYYQARAVSALLEKAVERGDLSHAGIMEAMNHLGTVTFDGLTGNYDYGKSAATRNPPRESTIFKVDAKHPGGLVKIKGLFASPAAKKFKFA